MLLLFQKKNKFQFGKGIKIIKKGSALSNVKRGNGLSNIKKGNGLSNIKKYGKGLRILR